MFDYFIKIIQFLFGKISKEKQIKPSKKILITFTILVVIVSIDYAFKISEDWYLKNKIENYNTYESFKKFNINDSIKINEIESRQKDILKGRHIYDLSLDYSKKTYSYLLSFSSKYSKIENINPDIVKNKANDNIVIRSFYLMFVTSNFYFFVVFVMLLFYPILKPSIYLRNYVLLKSTISLFLMFLIMLSITRVSYLIYKFENVAFNYFLNFIIHCLFWIPIVVLLKKSKNEKN